MNQQNWLKDKKAVENNELIKINANETHKNELSIKPENKNSKSKIKFETTVACPTPAPMIFGGRTLSVMHDSSNYPSFLTDDQLPRQWQCYLCKKHCEKSMCKSANQKEWYCSYECSDRDNDLFKCIKCNNFASVYENGKLITMGYNWKNITGEKGYYCFSCSEKKREEWNRNQKFSSTNTNNEEQQEKTSTSSNYSNGSYYSSANVEPESYQGDTKNYQTNSTSNNSEPELVLHKAASDNPQKELEQLSDFQSATDVEQTISTILANKEAQQEQTNSEKIALSNQENKKANSSSAPLIIAGVAIVGGVILASLMFIRKSKLKAVK